MSSSRFELTVSLNVLEHLGINLYSNVPSVLSEIVANAWDADATEVHIDQHHEENGIVIRDDGIGMTPDDVNTRFLTVGYRRRHGQPGHTKKGCRPIGRKGIGKLSLFSIANSVQIETAKDNRRSAFRMRLDDIRKKIQKKGGKEETGTYEPEVVEDALIDFCRGTRITLTELHRKKTTAINLGLRKRVARLFSILGSTYNFHIFINGEKIIPADLGYYDKLQYLWTYNAQEALKALCKNTDKIEDRTKAVRHERDISVTGWLGTVMESGQLKDEDNENLNRIAIFVRGKMAQENMLDDFSERGIYAAYLIVELHFNDLDTYDGDNDDSDEDAETSSRQHIVEDDPRYLNLRSFVGWVGKLNRILLDNPRRAEAAHQARCARLRVLSGQREPRFSRFHQL